MVLIAAISATGNSDCREVLALARATRAKSSAALASARRYLRGDYRARLVYAVRFLELRPNDRNRAIQLLNLLPSDDHQQNTLMTLGDSPCRSESVAEMESLGELRDRIPHDLATAVILAPEKLPEYLQYSLTSTEDPHNDYAIQMQDVCRKVPERFRSAVNELLPDKREWFVEHVFNPQTCRALALPEAQ